MCAFEKLSLIPGETIRFLQADQSGVENKGLKRLINPELDS
jgi:hypothetical protein